MHEKFSTLASTATSQNGVLTYEQLLADGLSHSQITYRVKQGQLVRRPGRILLMPGSADTWLQRLTAASLAAALHTRVPGGPIGAASHRSASRLYGFRTVDDDVDVSVLYPRKLHLPGANTIRSRDLEVGDITWVNSIPTTTPERTICDLGLKLPEHEVMRILRHCVAIGLIDRRDVLRMRLRISEHGRDGAGIIGRCIEALAELAELTESGLEAMFLEMCETFGVPIPILQLPVIALGRSYRLDFAYPAQKIFVEIDGAGHAEPAQISHDGGRQNDLVSQGWHPVRFGYRQLKNEPEYCAHQLRHILTSVTPDV